MMMWRKVMVIWMVVILIDGWYVLYCNFIP